MEYKVYYNGQETSDFDTLAGWFVEVYNKMRSLEKGNKQYIDILKEEKKILRLKEARPKKSSRDIVEILLMLLSLQWLA